MTEHLSHVEVERLHAVALLEREVSVAGCLAYNVQRSTLALCDATYMVDVLLVDEQAHALLTLVGDDFLRRKCFVADRQLSHVDFAAALLNKLRETVEVTCRTVVVDRNYRVYILLAQSANEVVCTLLHLRVGTLHGVQLDAVAVATSINRRYRATAQADAVVVAAYNDNLVALLRLLLQTVALCAVAYAACKHDNLVVSVLLGAFLMLEGEHRTGDERLSELVAEVRRTVRCLDENLLWCLIQPLAYGHDVLPVACEVIVVLKTRISSHVYGCSGDRP